MFETQLLRMLLAGSRCGLIDAVVSHHALRADAGVSALVGDGANVDILELLGLGVLLEGGHVGGTHFPDVSVLAHVAADLLLLPQEGGVAGLHSWGALVTWVNGLHGILGIVHPPGGRKKGEKNRQHVVFRLAPFLGVKRE